MEAVEMIVEENILEELTNSVVASIECQQEPVVMNERYICCEQIGEGGLSLVYRAKDSYAEYFGDEKKIALKMPVPQLLVMKDIAAFVYSEYKILSQLQHPNIVKVLDFGINSVNEVPYLVLERLEGRLLDEVPLSSLSLDEKMELFNTLGEAIAYMHRQEVIHADIAPNNIMLLDDGTLRLFDFGISQIKNSAQQFHLDFSKIRAYNPKYVAPELLGGGTPTKESDIFSFAALMYELFTECSDGEECTSLINEDGVTKSQLRSLPRELRKWFNMALNPDPEKRDHTLERWHKTSFFG